MEEAARQLRAERTQATVKRVPSMVSAAALLNDGSADNEKKSRRHSLEALRNAEFGKGPEKEEAKKPPKGTLRFSASQEKLMVDVLPEPRKGLVGRIMGSTHAADNGTGTHGTASHQGTRMQVLRRRIVFGCRVLLKTKVFQVFMFLVLMVALFLPDVWVLANMPDSSDMDIILTVVLVLFFFELGVQSLGHVKTYLLSFFFWMDLIGALSLLLDLSYVGLLSDNSTQAKRIAGMLKLGARVGRFTKLVKLLRFLPGMGEASSEQGTAKTISARLINSVSIRVSCLIIVLVVVTPLFSLWTYPTDDLSLEAWLVRLEMLGYQDPANFASALTMFGSFYKDKAYYPYALNFAPDSSAAAAAFPSRSAQLLPWRNGEEPKRTGNRYRIQEGNLTAYFNFQSTYQTASLTNLLLLLTIMFLMISFSFVLTSSVSTLVLKPLEKLLLQVRQTAATIFKSVANIDRQAEENEEEKVFSEDDDEEGPGMDNETELLERVLAKLSQMQGKTANKKNAKDKENEANRSNNRRSKLLGLARDCEENEDDKDEDEDAAFQEVCEAARVMLENAAMTLEQLSSWNINPLELDKSRNRAAVTYFLGPQNHRVECDTSILLAFIETVESSYNSQAAFHNWFHAVDTAHCVWRYLDVFSAGNFLTPAELYALLVSGLCHDIAHPGLTNLYLVNTSHEIALRYNDRSPLENMHACKLFEIVSKPETNIFVSMEKPEFRALRKACVDAILHTDNAKHFAIVKEVQMLFDLNAELFNVSWELYTEDPETFPTMEVVELLEIEQNRNLMVRLLLHLADISYATKPMRICRIWGYKVLEEFFAQGDLEKSQGLPLQALNDRDKVNRAMSQLSYTEFIVAPLFLPVLKILPPIHIPVQQMVVNVRAWEHAWQMETQPSPGETERRAIIDRVRKLEAKHRALITRQEAKQGGTGSTSVNKLQLPGGLRLP